MFYDTKETKVIKVTPTLKHKANKKHRKELLKKEL